jgi:adenine deaminase
VLYTDAGVMEKIAHAKALGKPIDGHAPGLTGEQARQYFSTGIATDHECYQLEEAMGKAALGVKILIREGSAARNFNTLLPLFHHYPDQLMFCSDDKHPDDLLLGHINTLVQRALAAGHDFVKVWKAASVNPVLHYRLPVGLLRVGDPADFLLIDQPTQHFKVLQTVIEGQVVAENGRTLLPEISDQPINCFLATPKKTEDFRYAAHAGELPVMVAIDRELITRGDRIACPPGSWVEADPAANLLKITVVNRYADKAPAVAFIRNFGLQKGALASSVAHDSHNIIAVGTDDHALALAVNAVIEDQGGIAATDGEQVLRLPLPVAGLMSVESGETVAAQYTALHQFAKNVLGSPLSAPFMTLSFMALLVIPRYKLSDKGLFDGESFTFVKVNQEKP